MIRALALACLASSALWAQNIVSEKAIHQVVERHVRAALQRGASDQERCEVRARWKGDVVLDEPGPVEIEVKPLSARPLRGAGLVRVELKVKGQTRRTLTVSFEARIYRRVLVASRMIRRGEMLGAELLEEEERDVTLAKDGYYTEVSQVQGMQAKRPLSAGEVLTRQHTQSAPLVRQGDAVEMVVDSGRMQVSALGVALQDGGAGARIRVKNPESGKVLRGEVLAAGIVRMGGGEGGDD